MTAAGAAVFILAGSATLGLQGTAAAESPLVAGSCGSTLRGEPGQPLTLDVASVLGISGGPTITLGTVQDGTKSFSVPGSQLLGAVGNIPVIGDAVPKLCSVTVTGVNTAAAPVEDGVQAGAETAKSAAQGARKAPNPGEEPQKPPAEGAPQKPAPQPNQPANPASPAKPATPADPVGRPDIPTPNSPIYQGGSPALGAPSFGGLPTSFGGGHGSMSAFSSTPANAGLPAPAPGVRYGGQIPGYAPQFGTLDDVARKPAENGAAGRASGEVDNAGQAEALPGDTKDGIGLPMLLAVLALSGVSATLVRTWVLRKATN